MSDQAASSSPGPASSPSVVPTRLRTYGSQPRGSLTQSATPRTALSQVNTNVNRQLPAPPPAPPREAAAAPRTVPPHRLDANTSGLQPRRAAELPKSQPPRNGAAAKRPCKSKHFVVRSQLRSQKPSQLRRLRHYETPRPRYPYLSIVRIVSELEKRRSSIMIIMTTLMSPREGRRQVKQVMTRSRANPRQHHRGSRPVLPNVTLIQIRG
jgi:hypothetical protein